jgi:hypothetical protein
MAADSGGGGKGTGLAMGGLGLAVVLCCGLPLLIAGGVLGGVGAVLGNPWVIGAAVALIAGGVVWRVRRSGSSSGSCCDPQSPARDDSRPADQVPTHTQES